MKAYFKKLFLYNRWAYDQFKPLFLKEDFSNDEIQRILSHCYNAEKIWIDRVGGYQTSIGVWDHYSFKECFDKLESSNVLWLKRINLVTDFDQMIIYSNSKGIEFKSSLSNILSHIANHGTHHRSQISILLRKSGWIPPATDFIFFTRN